MKLCSIQNCNKKHYAKNYCISHYRKFAWDYKAYTHKRDIGKNYIGGTCKVKNCEKGVFAKGFCRPHYNQIRYNKLFAKTTLCQAPACETKTKNEKYCATHFRKYLKLKKRGFPIDFSIHLMKGKFHPFWNGGVFDYPNHPLMRKQRRLKIKQTKGNCELCGEKGKHLHHKDKSKDNHTLENLLFLCVKCHFSLHKAHFCLK